jgi:hypothetical protein
MKKIKNLISFFYGELQRVIGGVPLLWHDRYPPLVYRGKVFRWLSRRKTFFHFRARYWKKVAIGHPPFKYFYTDNLGDLPLSDKCRRIAEKGFVEIEDFLPQEDLFTVQDEVRALIATSKQTGNEHLSTKDFAITKKEIIDRFNKFLEPHVHEFFGDGASLRSIYGQEMISKDGNDPGGGTSLWHADRFIPVINGVYFPFGCDWAPFERLKASPIITNQVVEYSRHHFMDLPSELVPLGTYQSMVPPNTLIIGMHHILHRRGPYITPGRRVALYPCWYNSFTAKHLRQGRFTS